MKRIILLIALLSILSGLTVFAQLRPVQRTEEFEKLNVFVGKWQVEGKVYPDEGIPPIEIKGESVFKWVIGKTWLMYESGGGGGIQGHAYMTWDKDLGQYGFFWFDNVITKPLEYYGNWSDSQTLVVNREKVSGESRTYLRITWRFITENEINVIREASTNGENFRVTLDSTYKRIL